MLQFFEDFLHVFAIHGDPDFFYKNCDKISMKKLLEYDARDLEIDPWFFS